jgi:L-seryl-tRNA(Ser) seleniumtransferase
MSSASLRSLPSVEKLLGHELLAEVLRDLPRSVVTDAVRDTLAEARAAIKGAKDVEALDSDTLAQAAAARARLAGAPALRRVLNATGIVLHTNLGRAPLSEQARRIVADVAAGYSSLEYDLEKGERGDRGVGPERWLTRLTGAEAAVVVNNGAGAILLTLAALAAGKMVVVSRGELVEIGGSFRVPEIMEMSGATLVEVGATNRTHVRDYEKALDKHHRDVGAILRVHKSNFRMEGFVHQPELAELATLAKERGIPLIEDLGSGALADLSAFGLEREPTDRRQPQRGRGCGHVLGGQAARRLPGRVDPRPGEAPDADPQAPAGARAADGQAGPRRTRGHAPVLRRSRTGVRRDPGARDARGERGPADRARAAPGERAARARAGPHDRRGLERGRGGRRLAAAAAAHGPGAADRAPHAHGLGAGARARAADPPVIGTIRADRFRLDPRTLTEVELAMAATSLAKVWTEA